MENEMYYLAKQISCKNFKHSLERMQDSFDERYEMKIDRLNILTIWVATDGNDETGDGSEERPFATLTRAIDAFGNVCVNTCNIKLKAGTYNITNTAIKIFKNITISGDTADNTILNVTASSSYFIQFHDGGSLSNLTINYTPIYDGTNNLIVCSCCFLNISSVYVNILSDSKDLHVFNNFSGFMRLASCRAACEVSTYWTVACWSAYGGYTVIYKIVEVPEGMRVLNVGNEAAFGGHIYVKGTWGASNGENYIKEGVIDTY